MRSKEYERGRDENRLGNAESLAKSARDGLTTHEKACIEHKAKVDFKFKILIAFMIALGASSVTAHPLFALALDFFK